MRLGTLTPVIALGLAAASVFAEDFRRWAPPDGVPIRQGYHIEWFQAVENRDAGNLAGEVGMVWSDCRWSDTQLGDRGVYMQVIGTDGQFKFGPGGVRVVDASNRQEDPGIWPSRTGGAWFVAWEDFETDDDGDIYCTKIDADGNRLWARDNPRGVPVCVVEGVQEDVRIAEDNEGGCIIAWRDMRSGDTGDIYAMHILADGRPDPDWPENGMVVVEAPGGQTNHTADEDGAGGMLIAWRDGRVINNFNIWAQRITPSGELMWGGGQGVIVCGSPANQESPKLCPDGAGGAFICWVDERNQETFRDIYAQRLNAQGQAMWTADGEPVCTVNREQTNNRIVNSYPGEAIIAWDDKRGDNLTYDLYAMRVSGDNRMVKQWNPATGVPICAVDTSSQSQVRLHEDGQGGAFFVWEDERNGGVPLVEIWAQRINRQGQVLWRDNGIPICTTRAYNNSVVVRRTADGGAAFVWGVATNGALGVYAHRVRSDGSFAWNDIRPVVNGTSGNARNPLVFPRDGGGLVAVWSDGRFADLGTAPFVQFLRDNGGHPEFTLAEGGVPALVGTVGGGENPDACTDGRGGAIVGWEDHRRGPLHSIYVQRIDNQGQRVWGDDGLQAAESQGYEQLLPAVCEDGAGGAFVAWKSDTDEAYTNLFMQHISADGERLWGDQGLRVTRHLTDNFIADLIYDGRGGCILVYISDDDVTQDDIWATRLDGNGDPQWGDMEGVPVCQADYDQRDVRVVLHQSGAAMVWVDARDSQPGIPTRDLYVQVLNLDGEPLLEEDGAVLMDTEYGLDHPRMAIDNRANLWVVFEDGSYAGTARGQDIKIQRFRLGAPNRRPLLAFGRDGMVLAGMNSDQLLPFIAHDGRNGMWVVWQDHRSVHWSDIYALHLDPDGRPYPGWDEGGNPVCTAFHRQEEPEVVSLAATPDLGVAMVWTDKRATGKEELFNIFAQRLDDDVLKAGGTAPAPEQFRLVEVSPNPFNAQARVVFQVGRDSRLELMLYDLHGRLVKDLGSGWWSAGTHRVLLNGDGLAAGTYLVRLSGEGVRVERQVQLVR